MVFCDWDLSVTKVPPSSPCKVSKIEFLRLVIEQVEASFALSETSSPSSILTSALVETACCYLSRNLQQTSPVHLI